MRAGSGQLSAEAVAALIPKMFVEGATGPQPSGDLPLCSTTDKQLVKFASDAINDRKVLPKACVDALSKSFGNFNRVCGLGCMLGDAVLGPPLLSHRAAYEVGLKARREAEKIDKQVGVWKKEASRAKGKLFDASDRDLIDQRLQGYINTLYQEAVDVELGGVAPAAAPGPSGSRKRARPAEVAEPTEEELIASAEAAVLAAKKVVKKATTRVERTEAKVGGASFYKYNESVNEYYMAEFQLLHDKLTLKDAELALSHLQWGAALEREQRLCAIGLESTKITREALDSEKRAREELRRERAKPSPYAVWKRMQESAAAAEADAAGDPGAEEGSGSDSEDD